MPVMKNTGPLTIDEEREEAVNGIFQLIGFGCIMTGQYADAGAISMHTPPISHEVAELAKKNESIARGVDVLLQAGPYAALIGAAMPLVLQLLVNHNVLPADKMSGANVVKPEVLEAQVKTQMAEQAMAAIRAQQESEQRLREMQMEMEMSQNGSDPSDD